MGLIDEHGLKKVISKIKDHFSNKISNLDHIIYTTSDELKTKQSRWSKLEFRGQLFLPQSITGCYDRVYGLKPSFAGYDGGVSALPNVDCEYKLRFLGSGLNTWKWPSTFDLPWPNNEIPQFEAVKYYEIYIAGGRVVSVDDITPPVEEVTYTITGIEGSASILVISTDGTLVEFYENGEFIDKSSTLQINVFGGVTKAITIKGNLSSIGNVFIQDLQYVKIDCSKTKSNNFHNVTQGLKIDEIIYPQECEGTIIDPRYEFETSVIDLNCLGRHMLNSPYFDFVVDDIVLNGPLYCISLDSTFESSRLTNKQINALVRYIDGYFESNAFSNSNLKTLGTSNVYDKPISISSQDALVTTSLKFAHISIIYSENMVHPHNIEELIVHNGFCVYDFGLLQSKIIVLPDYNASQYYRFDTFSDEGDPVTIYTFEEMSDEHKSMLPSRVTTQVISDISEVPFQYAPATWDDVKDYDEDGNPIE